MTDRTTEPREVEGRASVRNLYGGSLTEAEQEALALEQGRLVEPFGCSSDVVAVIH